MIGAGYVLWIHVPQQYNGLKDYKFYCFNGRVKYLYVSEGLEKHETARISFLTPDWKPAPFGRTDYKPFDILPHKPLNFDKMLSVAEALSKDFLFMRVDLYEINNKVYFSEFTFYPACGYMTFNPQEWDYRLGNELRII